MDSESGDMGKLSMIMENIINITSGTIFKMLAHREDKFAVKADSHMNLSYLNYVFLKNG